MWRTADFRRRGYREPYRHAVGNPKPYRYPYAQTNAYGLTGVGASTDQPRRLSR